MDDRSRTEAVGQLMMFGFHGTRVTDRLKRLIQERHLGGVIVFLRNIESAESLVELTHELQALSERPLFIAADQEGGSVLRVRRGATLLPSAMGLSTLDPGHARRMGEICGREMSAMGLNVNLAPVLEINHRDNPGIGMRAFGGDPETVTGHAVPYIEGLHAGGVLATAKHFPGKGRARLDAHLDLPVIDITAPELVGWELKPFVAAFSAGVRFAMTSHCVYRELEDLPATLSPRIMTNLLRGDLGFTGLLITDDMEMGAISRYHDLPAACEASFIAGSDQILICADEDLQDEVLDRFHTALETGELPEERVLESLERIRSVRSDLTPARGQIASLVVEHASMVDRTLDAMIRIVRDPHGHLPLGRGEAMTVYWPQLSRLTRVEEGPVGALNVRRPLEERFRQLTWIEYDPQQGPPGPLPEGGLVLFFSANAHLFEGQGRFLRELEANVPGLIHVVLRNPYDAEMTPRSSCVLVHGFLENAIRILMGKILAVMD